MKEPIIFGDRWTCKALTETPLALGGTTVRMIGASPDPSEDVCLVMFDNGQIMKVAAEEFVEGLWWRPHHLLAEWKHDRGLTNAVDVEPIAEHRLSHPAPAMCSLAPMWRGW